MNNKYYLITYKDSTVNIFSEIIDQEPQKWFIKYLKERIVNNKNSYEEIRAYEYAILYSKEISENEYNQLKELGI